MNSIDTQIELCPSVQSRLAGFLQSSRHALAAEKLIENIFKLEKDSSTYISDVHQAVKTLSNRTIDDNGNNQCKKALLSRVREILASLGDETKGFLKMSLIPLTALIKNLRERKEQLVRILQESDMEIPPIHKPDLPYFSTAEQVLNPRAN